MTERMTPATEQEAYNKIVAEVKAEGRTSGDETFQEIQRRWYKHKGEPLPNIAKRPAFEPVLSAPATLGPEVLGPKRMAPQQPAKDDGPAAGTS